MTQGPRSRDRRYALAALSVLLAVPAVAAPPAPGASEAIARLNGKWSLDATAFVDRLRASLPPGMSKEQVAQWRELSLPLVPTLTFDFGDREFAATIDGETEQMRYTVVKASARTVELDTVPVNNPADAVRVTLKLISHDRFEMDLPPHPFPVVFTRQGPSPSAAGREGKR